MPVQICYDVNFKKYLPEKEVFLGKYGRYQYSREGEKYLVRTEDVYGGQSQRVTLKMSVKAGEGSIYLPGRYENDCRDEWNLASFLGIEFMLPQYRRIMMHASIVRYRGEGILFTGPSGIGKSTQAALWENYRGAEILNGDRAILQVEEKTLAWGSPYAGSSCIYRNESSQVRAIVLLEQGERNEIRLIGGKEKVVSLYPRFLLMSLEKELLEKQLELLEEIVRKIPVYQLRCRPDESAVEALEDILKSSH